MASYQYIYVMKDLCKTFPGGKEVLKHIWLSFFPGAKIGVIGPNGAGKSTLMKIMAGLDDNFTGEAWPAEGVKVGYLPQEPQLDPTKNVIENIMDGVGEVRDLMKRWEEVNNAFADPDADMDKLLAEQAELQEKIVRRPMPMSQSYPVVKNAVWLYAVCCYPNRICYCWMNRPTIWMPNPLLGCRSF